MRNLIAVVIAALLMGCVGVVVPSSETRGIDITRQYRLHEMSPERAWDKEPHVADGKQTVDSVRKWCGIVLVAVIVPIPLMLPVCESYIEAAYEGGTPKSATLHRIRYDLYACGPFMWVAALDRSYRGGILCGAVKSSDD